MKINTRIRYGLRTMIEIANHSGTDGVLQKDIAKYQNISLKYLDNIISALKLKRLIVNVKGKGSGYRLARPANEITMWDIYTAFENIAIVDCVNNKNFCDASCDCLGRMYWTEFKQEFEGLLFKKSLAEIISKTNI